MPSRNVRRRHNKKLARLQALPSEKREEELVRRLLEWRREAYARAKSLDAAPVWKLASDPWVQAVCMTLDPSGELMADLTRICAEAVDSAVGGALARRVRETRPHSAAAETPPPDERPVDVTKRREGRTAP